MMCGMATPPSLGHRIREARELKHWTQQQLADAVGVSKRTVNNWENDRVSAPRSSIAAIEQVLNIAIRGEPHDHAPPAVARKRRLSGDEIDVLRAEILRLTQAVVTGEIEEQPEPEEEPPRHARRRKSA